MQICIYDETGKECIVEKNGVHLDVKRHCANCLKYQEINKDPFKDMDGLMQKMSSLIPMFTGKGTIPITPQEVPKDDNMMRASPRAEEDMKLLNSLYEAKKIDPIITQGLGGLVKTFDILTQLSEKYIDTRDPKFAKMAIKLEVDSREKIDEYITMVKDALAQYKAGKRDELIIDFLQSYIDYHKQILMDIDTVIKLEKTRLDKLIPSEKAPDTSDKPQ